ncbi:hypothetical protein quinque_014990 [Culex quinquefasciatus]
MLLCLFVFLWKILRNMSTISATIQQERQLELLKLQLLDHQRRRLRHMQKVHQQQQQCQLAAKPQTTNYQKLKKMGRGQAAKENFLLARFLFGTEQGTIPEDGAGEEEELGYLPGGGGDFASEKDLKFLRMSDYPQKQQQQSGKFVLSQQNQQRQHPPPPPSPLAAAAGVIHQRRHPQQHLSQQNSPLHRREGRRPLASNYCWSSSSNVAGNVPTPTPTAAAGSFHCYYPDVVHDGDDTLKSNVQIVLDNINRNYHALREQILNNHHQQQQQHQNQLNNNNVSQDTNQVLLQRLQSVSQQLKKGTTKMAATSPDSDTNCNPYLPVTGGCGGGVGIGGGMPLSCSIASSQDFSHDYSDYQWFMDYGSYRDGITHQSILSALSASYNGIGELSYYEDLAKNIDANLAEVDMESFRTEDIHSLLTTNSAEFRHSRHRNNNRGESGTAASRSGLELNLAGIGGHNGMDSSEICKSELLFSPVKESHISVDSLDMDGYPDEDDIILTCQANKNNYTIAFEQSALYSDESFYDGPENYGKYKQMNALNHLDQLIRRKAQETAMSVSEVGYTTWSKLRNNGPGQRFPLVTAANPFINQISRHAPTCFVRKSLSMPDLKEKCGSGQPLIQEPLHAPPEQMGSNGKNQLNVSQVPPAGSSCAASSESYGKQMRTLLPMPSDFNGTNGGGSAATSADGSQAPLRDSSCDNNEDDLAAPSHQQQQQPSFNLVKLFIKQKSSSTDTCMDVSSGCWPSDSSGASGSGTNAGAENNNNSNTNLAVASSKDAQRSRKKSMNDSGKCSTLGRHEEEEFQFDSLDAVGQGDEGEKGGKLNDFNSPVHKRNYKAYNMNIAGKNVPAMNPVVYNLMNNNGVGGSGTSITNQQNNNNNNNNNNSFKDTNSDASRTSENLTQIFNVTRSSQDKTRVPIEMITKSMQTSFIGVKEKVRVVPPSFLDRLQKLGDKQKAPVFVVYPNYVLPDLGFLNSSQQKDGVVISPLSFKENFGSKGATTAKKPRPVSMNDIENIRAKEYKHVLDWKSLVTLLPQEYRKLLRNIPEANAVASDDAGQKPLFCMTPPLRRGRGVTCDCVNLLGQTQTYNSSSSGGSSSQPPSSGYRGSSTMLTDSEMDLLGPNASATGFSNNMYVYQYDSPAEVSSAERPPSGRTPKGILRRAPAKAKRNSMFEENQRVHTAEKRRSLQEPCYNFSDEQLSILEEDLHQPRKVNNSPNMSQHQPRLPNTPKLPSADDYHRLNKLNDLNDFELKQAVSNKLNQRVAQQLLHHEDDLDARIRAEHFLSNVPKSELKHYAEIAHVLETTTAEGATAPSEEAYDRNRLRHEVSRALSQRKNVSFNSPNQPQKPPQLLRPTEIKFSTPPNSPNMSVVGAQRPPTKPTTPTEAEREKQDKIQSNRFKRLQIQWELLSKDGAQLKQELGAPRSGGNTPTGAMKSRIPRPVSYPTTRANSDPMVSKTLLRSPSRIVAPSPAIGTKKKTVAAPQPAPRTPSKLLHTTPKKSAAGVAGGPSKTASSPAVMATPKSQPAMGVGAKKPTGSPIIRKPITTTRPPGKKPAAAVAAKA